MDIYDFFNISLFMQEKLHLCHLLQLHEYIILDQKINQIKDDHAVKYGLEKIGDTLFDK